MPSVTLSRICFIFMSYDITSQSHAFPIKHWNYLSYSFQVLGYFCLHLAIRIYRFHQKKVYTCVEGKYSKARWTRGMRRHPRLYSTWQKCILNIHDPGSGSVTQGHREKWVQKSCAYFEEECMDTPLLNKPITASIGSKHLWYTVGNFSNSIMWANLFRTLGI